LLHKIIQKGYKSYVIGWVNGYIKYIVFWFIYLVLLYGL